MVAAVTDMLPWGAKSLVEMKQAAKDGFTTWAAASAIWICVALTIYELLNLLLGKPFGRGIQSLPLFVISGAVSAGLIAVAAGYLARQRVISDQVQRRHGD